MTDYRYVRHNRDRATSDTDGTPWVACDESGQDGENLVSASKIVFAHGSVRCDDTEATAIVADLKSVLPRSQSKELKFRSFDNSYGVDALRRLLGEQGMLHGRAYIYLTHKTYMAASKAIDLLVEEAAHARGENIYYNGEARRMARTLFRDGPRALGHDEFSRLMQSFVSLFLTHRGASGASKETVEGFFATVEEARWRSYRRSVETILQGICAARVHADEFQKELAEAGRDNFPALDPLIPSLAEAIRYWCDRPAVGSARFLHDRVNVLTDSRINDVLHVIRRPTPEFWRLTPPMTVDELVRGNSDQHASLQLADIVAGAGRAAAEFALGIRTDPTAAELIRIVRPIISLHSLWGDDVTWMRLTGRKLAT